MTTNINLSGVSQLNEPSFNLTKDAKSIVDESQKNVTEMVNSTRQAVSSLFAEITSGVAGVVSEVTNVAKNIVSAPLNAIKGIINPEKIVSTILGLLLQNDKIVALLSIVAALQQTANNLKGSGGNTSNIASAVQPPVIPINKQQFKSMVPNNLLPNQADNKSNDFTGSIFDYKKSNIDGYLSNNLDFLGNNVKSSLQTTVVNSGASIKKVVTTDSLYKKGDNKLVDSVAEEGLNYNNINTNQSNNSSIQSVTSNMEAVVSAIFSINTSLLEINNTIKQYNLANNKKNINNTKHSINYFNQ